MGFLDNLRDRFAGRDDDYDDDFYDDDDFDDFDEDEDDFDDDAPQGTGLLGNSRRPEPESVAVYTRSGRHVTGTGSYDDADDFGRAPAPVGGYSPREPYSPASTPTYAAETQVMSRPAGNQLPPYVLKPASYDDAQMVVRRVRTNQPVVLVLHSTPIDAAKRILDFCYGLSVGMGGAVQELGDRVFVVLPAGAELSASDIDKLVADGDLAR